MTSKCSISIIVHKCSKLILGRYTIRIQQTYSTWIPGCVLCLLPTHSIRCCHVTKGSLVAVPRHGDDTGRGGVGVWCLQPIWVCWFIFLQEHIGASQFVRLLGLLGIKRMNIWTEQTEHCPLLCAGMWICGCSCKKTWIQSHEPQVNFGWSGHTNLNGN